MQIMQKCADISYSGLNQLKFLISSFPILSKTFILYNCNTKKAVGQEQKKTPNIKQTALPIKTKRSVYYINCEKYYSSVMALNASRTLRTGIISTLDLIFFESPL